MTIEGTSMSAPTVTGIVALMLQKKWNLGLDEVIKVLKESSRQDKHTGNEEWNPVYGYGKIDVQKALAKI